MAVLEVAHLVAAPKGVWAHKADGGRKAISHNLITLAKRGGQFRRAEGGQGIQIEAARHVEGYPVGAVFDVCDIPAFGRELFHHLGENPP